MANKIREILTDDVLDEILARYKETYDNIEGTKRDIDSIPEIETLEDFYLFLENIPKMDVRIAPWREILLHYLIVKKYGFQTADKTGLYMCTFCKNEVCLPRQLGGWLS